jgi:hypothetical protein
LPEQQMSPLPPQVRQTLLLLQARFAPQVPPLQQGRPGPPQGWRHTPF